MTLRDRVQLIASDFLAQNRGVSERLSQGDTLARHAAFADVRDHVIRHYPHEDMDWYTWQVTRQEIVKSVEEWCRTMAQT